MKPIQMVDLAGQHSKIRGELQSAMQEVMDSTAFIRGPQVARFQKNLAAYLDVKHVIGCANGTDALQLALMVLDLPKGSEIITPDFTFIATAEVVILLGYKPVIVDVDPDTFTLDIEKLRKAITPSTKAIVPVHLFGQCADMEPIMALAKEHDLYVIEDTAQANGTDYIFSNGERKKAGTIGHIGCTSFFPSKNLGAAGDGGAIFTNDDKIASRISLMANHGMKDAYYYDAIGINSRLDSLQAAILDVKLKYLEEYNKARQAAADAYDKAFSGYEMLQIPKRAKYSTHIFHQYTLRLKDGRRDELQRYLNEKGIPSKVYYPVPIHKQDPYAEVSRFDDAQLEVTNRLADEVLSLPMHTELTGEQLDYITETVKDFFTVYHEN
jgi:UDP-2-acetamido-2-deoxy-ribo-hexuluronate aminotransferase